MDRDRFSTNQLQVEPIFGGDRFVLPQRKLGRAGNFGWILVGSGLIGVGFMVTWMGLPIAAGVEELRQQQGWFGWIPIGFGLFGVSGLVPSLGLLVAGLAVVCDRTRSVIELRDGWLVAKEKFFFISWRRKCRLQSIRRLRFGAGTSESGESLPSIVGELATALVAEGDGVTFVITAAYPRTLLAELAEELASHAEDEIESASLLTPRDGTKREAPPIQVVEGFPHDEERVWEKPADSDIVLTRHDHGVKIEAPAVGVMKGSRGLLFFGILWNGILSVIVPGFVIGIINGGDDAPPWFVMLFLLPFVGVGVGVLLAAFNWGRRRTAIVTAHDRLLIVSESIFGQKRREWSKAEIAEICHGASGMEVNDVPLKELQVHHRAGKKFGCLTERSDDELGWIAYELSQALGVQRVSRQGEVFVENVTRDTEGRAIPSTMSPITLTRDHAVTRIHVPPQGLGKHAILLVLGVLFCLIGCGVSTAVFWDDLKNGFQTVELGKLGFILLWGTMFVGGGIAMFCIGLVAARRSVDIEIDATQLRVKRRGVFAEKSLLWARDGIERVRIVDSGTQVNSRRLYQLRIYPHRDSHFSMMTGHDQADLAFVATTIREALGMEEQAEVSAV